MAREVVTIATKITTTQTYPSDSTSSLRFLSKYLAPVTLQPPRGKAFGCRTTIVLNHLKMATRAKSVDRKFHCIPASGQSVLPTDIQAAVHALRGDIFPYFVHC